MIRDHSDSEVEYSDAETEISFQNGNRPRALQLIHMTRSEDFEEKLELHLDSKVLDTVLATCEGRKLCVITVTGEARSGKSFLSNFIKSKLEAADSGQEGDGLSQFISGFECDSGYQPKTKGIWIWSRAFLTEGEDDEKIAVLLMDTEGFRDEFTAPDEIAAILGISLLTSSIVIMNLSGDLTGDPFEWLSILGKIGGLDVTKDCKSKPYQKLSFLVRDWTRLSDYTYGRQSGGRLLSRTISSIPRIGEKLQNCFEEMECFLLPHIGAKALLKSYSGNAKDLDKEFHKRLNVYLKSLLKDNNLLVKKTLGNPLTPELFKKFMTAYETFFNNLEDFDIFGSKSTGIWHATRETARKIKIELGISTYNDIFNKRKQSSPGGYIRQTTINSLSVQAKSKALLAFQQFALSEEEERTTREDFLQLVEKARERIRTENEGARKTLIAAEIGKACGKLRSEMEVQFSFTPEVDSRVPANMVFYDEEKIRKSLDTESRSIQDAFLDAFSSEDETGERTLKETLHSVLEPIGEEYLSRNQENRERAINRAQELVHKLKEEYLTYMKSTLEMLPEMNAKTLKVFHVQKENSLVEKFQQMRFGTDSFQAHWLAILKEELETEHEKLELDLDATLKGAQEMVTREIMQYKQELSTRANEIQSQEEIHAVHETMSEAIKRRFRASNPFPEDNPRTELMQRKLENSLEATFREVVEEGILIKRKLQEDLENAMDGAVTMFMDQLTGKLDEIDFVMDQKEFKDLVESCEQKAFFRHEQMIKDLSLDDGMWDTERDKLRTTLESQGTLAQKENEKRKSQVVEQADMLLVQLLGEFESKMTLAVAKLNSREDLLQEQRRFAESIVHEFGHRCIAKNVQFKDGYVLSLRARLNEIFSDVEAFFDLKLQAETVGLKTALLEVRKGYNQDMEREFTNKNHFFKENELKKVHQKVRNAALRKIPADHPLSKDQQKEVEHQLEILYRKYKERNDLIKKSFEGQEPAIGIDLGTTYSCTAIYLHGKVQMTRNTEGDNTTPSYVAINMDDTTTCGITAKDSAYEKPEATIFDAKRIIGRRWDDKDLQNDMKFWPFMVVEEAGNAKIEVHGKKYFPEQISAKLLTHLKKEAESIWNLKIKKAVITVPAYFTDGQRQATIDAGKLAGLEVLGILNEPTAAAISYRVDWFHAEDLKKILVFDLGGGTFDVAVLDMSEEKIEVLSIAGDDHLGGEDFDKNMMKHCAEKFRIQTGIDLFKDKDSINDSEKNEARRRLRRLQSSCEKAKKMLTTAKSTKISIAAFVNSKDLIVEVSREEFEKMNHSLFQKTIDTAKMALKSARLSTDEVDEIVLVGGSTRIPKLRDMLQKEFNGKPLNSKVNPDEAVAHGAAVQAAILAAKPGSKLFDFDRIQDVTPMSLGIEIATKDFDVIIPKNTKIPAIAKQEYWTYRNGQTSAWIRIFQGEERKAEDNRLLGDFTLEGIPPNKAGQECVDVTMEIDANGILNVEAVCRTTKDSKKITVVANKGRISEEVKARLIEEAKK